MKPSTPAEDRDMAFDYKALRLMVGLIAFLLPWTVIIITGAVTSSISASYHTDVRDLFVGALFVIGALMLAYNGHKFELSEENAGKFWKWLNTYWEGAIRFRIVQRRHEERMVSLLGGMASIAAALCPTLCEAEGCTPDLKSRIHSLAAVVLFSAVVYFCLVGFLDQVRGKDGRAKLRARIYLVCGIGMIVVLLACLAAPRILTVDVANALAVTFWAETAALSLFGVAWMTASKFLWFLVDDESEQLQLGGAKIGRPRAKRQEASTGA